MKRIAIYPRKSVFRDNSESVSVQINLCKEYANILFRGENLEFLIYSKDEGFSGKNTNRPSYQEMMADVQNNMIDAVIVYKLDRISRNVREFSEMFGILQEHNTAFISVKETFDTSTPIGRTVMYILAAFAQLERENTSERVSDSMYALGEYGYWTGGKLSLGMTSCRKVVNGREHSFLITDDASIWKVRLLGDLLLNGYSITKLERYLRDNDIKSTSGFFLSVSQISNILHNPVYCQNSIEAYHHFQSLGCKMANENLFDGKHGLIGYGKTKIVNDERQPKAEYKNWSIAVGIHKYVFTFEEWLALQQRIGVNKQFRSSKYKIAILKGCIFCGCGSRMAIRSYMQGSNMYSYYYCQKAVRWKTCPIHFYPVKDIDTLFLDKLKAIRLDPGSIQLSSEQISDDFHSPKDIRSKILNTEAAIKNLTIRLQENSTSAASKYIVEQIEELDHKLSALQSQLRRAELITSQQHSADEKRNQIYNDICFLLDNFENMEYVEQNELVRKVTQKCILYDNTLEILF